MSNVHQKQTEDNEPRFLIESPVPCSGINSNYTARCRAPNVNLEFMQSFQKISIVHSVRVVLNRQSTYGLSVF